MLMFFLPCKSVGKLYVDLQRTSFHWWFIVYWFSLIFVLYPSYRVSLVHVGCTKFCESVNKLSYQNEPHPVSSMIMFQLSLCLSSFFFLLFLVLYTQLGIFYFMTAILTYVDHRVKGLLPSLPRHTGTKVLLPPYTINLNSVIMVIAQSYP